MPRVRFLAKPGWHQVPAGESYEAGQEYILTDEQAGRWMRRGLVVIVPPAPEPAPEPVAIEPAAEPDAPRLVRSRRV